MTIMCVYIDLSREAITCYHSCTARLFEWIELSVAIKHIYVNKTKWYIRVKNRFAYARFHCSCSVEFPADVKVSRVSIPTSIILHISPHWNSLSEEDDTYRINVFLSRSANNININFSCVFCWYMQLIIIKQIWGQEAFIHSWIFSFSFN